MALLRRLFVASLICAMCAVVHASARQPSIPRVVNGRVVLADDTPVRRAHVVVTGAIAVETDSDPDGVFHLNNLPAGRYTVAAAKPGFVMARPAVIDVAADAGEATIKVPMTRAGAIAGRLTDQTGRILADSVVELRSGTARIEMLTDDRGMFRFHTLREGPYTVWAAGEEQTTAHDVTVVSGRTEDVQIVATAPNEVPSGPDEPEPDFDKVPAGGHVIRGRVTSEETGGPLAAIVIRVSGAQQSMQTVRTSVSGRYLVSVPAAGNYAVSASGPPKYPTMVYGQKDLSSPPGLVVIASNQSIADVNFEMPETKTLAGHVVDEFGDPAPNVTAVTVQPIVVAGKVMFVALDPGRGISSGALTNDLGEFRLRDVAPGRCFLVALSGPFASISGGPNTPPTRGYGYAPTFFPGTAIPGDAQPLVIAPKGTPTPVVFAMAATGMGTVTGRVLNQFGRPPDPPVNVSLMPLHGGDIRMIVAAAHALTDRNGVFTIEHVPAGSFVAQAGGNGFASETLTVLPGQTSAPELHMYAPSAIRGRFVFDGASDPSLLKNVRIRALNIDLVRGPLGSAPLTPNPNTDGTFEIPNLIGSNILIVDAPAPWMLLSVTYGGADMTDRPFDASAGDAEGVIVRFVPHTNTLTGTVTDRAGQPLASGSVIIFPQDSSRWAYPSRGVRLLTTDPKGSFSTIGLPPGVYRAVPFEAVPRVDWMNPEYLQTIQGLGDGFTIGSGESIALRLQFRK